MYIVLLRLADDTKVPEHLDGHRRWLQRGFEENVFFLTGGIPWVGGGAIIAAGLSPDALSKRLDEDPFIVHGVATPDVVELETTMTDPRLAFLK
jgi:uncharacterized protein YciI